MSIDRRLRGLETIWPAPGGTLRDEVAFIAAEAGVTPAYLRQEAERLVARFGPNPGAIVEGLALELGGTADELVADVAAARERYRAAKGAA